MYIYNLGKYITLFFQIPKESFVSMIAVKHRMCEAGDVVFPGDEITESSHDGKIILGPGLSRDCESIIINKTGILRHRQPNIYWVDSHQKRVSYYSGYLHN